MNVARKVKNTLVGFKAITICYPDEDEIRFERVTEGPRSFDVAWACGIGDSNPDYRGKVILDRQGHGRII